MSAHAEKAAAWIYSGIWGVLVSWFRVPADPPSLPSAGGEESISMKPDLGLVRYQKLFFWILLTIIDGALTIIWVAITAFHPIIGAILFIPYLVVAFVPDILAYIAIHLRYDTTWYVLSPRALRIRRGIWVIHETTLTYENIQNVDVRQGPVERFFGISTLVVRTAGGGEVSEQSSASMAGAHVGVLQGIADPQGLRDQILKRAAASRSAGLGDERHSEVRRHRPASGFSPAHLALLREIRDNARALRA